MVLIAEAALCNVYQQIKQDALAGVCTVLVLVAMDVDALCGAQILLELLHTDCIAHHLYPVNGYRDLEEANRAFIVNNDELRSVVLLNCGATIDLHEHFDMQPSVTWYVFDSHRPFNLDGLFGSDQIMVVGGGLDDDADVPLSVRDAYLRLHAPVEAGDELENDVENDVENTAENADSRRSGKRRANFDEDANASEDDEDGARARKRAKAQKSHQREVAEYYGGGSYFGTSVAVMLFRLAAVINRTSSNALWLGIVGLTSQLVHDRIGRASYFEQYAVFRDEARRLAQISSAGGPLGELLLDADDAAGDGGRASSAASDTTIRAEPADMRLMLYRHWSLWEALFYSPYVATKLGIWKEKGRQRLTNMLAVMGFPHVEYTQPYTDMSLPLRRDLRRRLESKAALYGLTELTFPSFSRQFGFKCALSASDVVFAVTALLDSGIDWLRRLGTREAQLSLVGGPGAGSGSSGSGAMNGGAPAQAEGVIAALLHSNEKSVATGDKTGAGGADGRFGEEYASWQRYLDSPADSRPNPKPDGDGDEVHDEQALLATPESVQRAPVRRGNFYVALDALGNVALLRHGIHLAMHVQSDVVRTGIAVLDNKMIKTLKRLRLVVLGGGKGSGAAAGADARSRGRGNGIAVASEYRLFGTSAVHLERLGMFLMDALRVYQKTALPLVVAAINDVGDHYLVLGVAAPPGANASRGDAPRNTFGLAFQAAAQDARSRFRMDSFDSFVMEIQRDDLAGFIVRLQATIGEFGSG